MAEFLERLLSKITERLISKERYIQNQIDKLNRQTLQTVFTIIIITFFFSSASNSISTALDSSFTNSLKVSQLGVECSNCLCHFFSSTSTLA